MPRAATRPRVEKRACRPDAELLEHGAHQLLDPRVARGVGHEHPRQRPHLHGQPVVARRLEPAVLALGVELLVRRLRPRVVGLRLAARRVQALVVAPRVVVPGVLHVLGDLLRVEGLDLGEVLAADDARGEEEARLLRVVQGVLPVDEVVAHAAPVARPVLVERGHREQIGDVDPGHEVAGLRHQPAHESDRAHVDRGLLVGVHGGGHAAHQEALEVRVLAPEHGVDLDDLALPVERFEVVGHGHEVGLGRQLVRRSGPSRRWRTGRAGPARRSSSPGSGWPRSRSGWRAASPRWTGRAPPSWRGRP